MLQEIHEQLRLPDWDLAHDHVMAYLASIEGYRANQYAISAAERKMVDAAWRQEMLDL